MSKRLNDALAPGGTYHDVSERLRTSEPGDPSLELRALVNAFGYHLFERSQVDGRDREEAPYGPMMEFDDRRFPPRLREIAGVELDVWVDAYEAIDDPRLRSRFGDLLWVRKHGERPDRFARGAVEAMSALADDGDWSEMERIRALVRAAELSVELRDEELQRAIARTIVDEIERELRSGNLRPGISLKLIDALGQLPTSQRPSELGLLLNQAHEVYGADPWQVDTIVDLKARLLPNDKQIELRQAQVSAWHEQAGQATGIVRASHLERALEIASAFGLVAEARALRVELQEMRQEDLGLQMFSAETSLPADQVERFVSAFLTPDTLSEALVAFGTHGPAGGEPDELVEEVRHQMSAIQFVFPKVVLDPDLGMPLFRATDEATHLRAEVASRRRFAAQIWSVFALSILRRMRERYEPSHDELADAFLGELVDEPLADRFARALELLWDGHPDDSAHLSAPRLESVIRGLARSLQIPIMNEPRGEKVGGVRTLGGVLDALDGAFPTPGWHAHMQSLLVDPLGANLRNVVAHGLRSSISDQDAGLLIHAASFFRSLKLASSPDTSTGG